MARKRARRGSKAKSRSKTPQRGFQAIKKAKVAQIRARGSKTAGGKRIKDPEAYVAAGLRRTGIAKYGEKGFAARQRKGRRKSSRKR